MVKILLWVIIVAAGMLGLRLLNVAKAKREAAASRPPGKPEVEAMVQCVRCGVYLPRTDALPSAAGLTCGDPGCRPQPSRES